MTFYVSGNTKGRCSILLTLLALRPVPLVCTSSGSIFAVAREAHDIEQALADLRAGEKEQVHRNRKTIFGDVIKRITGGAACTMKQWTRRFTGFSIVVFDSRTLSLKYVDPQSDIQVAEIMSLSLCKNTEQRYLDLETVIPSTLIAPMLNPMPLVHFKDMHMDYIETMQCRALVPAWRDTYISFWNNRSHILCHHTFVLAIVLWIYILFARMSVVEDTFPMDETSRIARHGQHC